MAGCKQKTIEIYEKSGQPMYLRPLDNTLELIKPWTIDEPGVKLLEEWADVDARVSANVKETWGAGALNGIILKK